jgi:hypothetical protein
MPPITIRPVPQSSYGCRRRERQNPAAARRALALGNEIIAAGLRRLRPGFRALRRSWYVVLNEERSTIPFNPRPAAYSPSDVLAGGPGGKRAGRLACAFCAARSGEPMVYGGDGRR